MIVHFDRKLNLTVIVGPEGGEDSVQEIVDLRLAADLWEEKAWLVSVEHDRQKLFHWDTLFVRAEEWVNENQKTLLNLASNTAADRFDLVQENQGAPV